MIRKLLIIALGLNLLGLAYFAVSLVKVNVDIPSTRLKNAGKTFEEARVASQQLYGLSGEKEKAYLSTVETGKAFWEATIEGVAVIRELSFIGCFFCLGNSLFLLWLRRQILRFQPGTL
jgi:hypothetical protein